MIHVCFKAIVYTTIVGVIDDKSALDHLPSVVENRKVLKHQKCELYRSKPRTLSPDPEMNPSNTPTINASRKAINQVLSSQTRPIASIVSQVIIANKDSIGLIKSEHENSGYSTDSGFVQRTIMMSHPAVTAATSSPIPKILPPPFVPSGDNKLQVKKPVSGSTTTTHLLKCNHGPASVVATSTPKITTTPRPMAQSSISVAGQINRIVTTSTPVRPPTSQAASTAPKPATGKLSADIYRGGQTHLQY